MSAQGPFQVTEQFERALCKYTGAPYAVAVDSCSSALFLALTRADVRGREVAIPNRTYPSVPCEVIHAGGRVRFVEHPSWADGYLTGPYSLGTTGVFDCALRFTAGMYQPGRTQCLSFSGAYKHLKLGKGGAILTDSAEDAAWFKRARFSGRNECSYHDDHFDMLGWNCYMHPLIAAQGLLLMGQFLRADGSRAVNADLSIRFPDLSRFPIYTNPTGDDPYRDVPPTREEAMAAARKKWPNHELIDATTIDGPFSFEPGLHIGAQDFTVTPEDSWGPWDSSGYRWRERTLGGVTYTESEFDPAKISVSGAANKIGAGLLSDHDPTGELGDVLRGFVGSGRVTERAGVPIRAVVPEPAEPHPDYYAYRGNP